VYLFNPHVRRPKIKTCDHGECKEPAAPKQRLCMAHLRAYIERNAAIRVEWAKKQAPKTELREFGETFTYAVAGAGLVKLGQALDPTHRLKILQLGSPVKLELLGAMRSSARLENRLHRFLKAHREHGEWFNHDAEQVQQIVDCIKAKDHEQMQLILGDFI
jgi:hypothetical protein